MPVHDWTRVFAGIFHHFHHEWISEIDRAVNRSLQGTEYYALAEQVAGGFGPDVLTLQRPVAEPRPAPALPRSPGVGLALADAPPRVRFRIKDDKRWYAKKKKAVAIRHVSDHRLIAVLEIVSPGNKSSKTAIKKLRNKAEDLLDAGVHLALVDLFPPTPRDPEGIHPLIWGEDEGHTFRFDPARPRSE